MLRLIACCAFLLVADPVSAHSGDAVGLAWNWDPWVVLPLALSGGLYAQGVQNLWSRAGRGRGIRMSRVMAFTAGWCLLALATVTPLHAMGEQLLTAHMVEHEILMAAAAPLLAFSRPIGAFLWALPKRWRGNLIATVRTPAVIAGWGVLTAPFAATLVHAAAIWAWHAPPLFEAALADPVLHRLQHVSFLATALLFWWSLAKLPKREYGFGAAQLFLTMIHTGLLGALITLAPRVLYPIQTEHALVWGLQPLEDQQLAGLLMWVPAGLVYLGAALAMLGVWIARPSGKVLRGAVFASR